MKNSLALIAAGALLLVSGGAILAQDEEKEKQKIELKDDAEKLSYALGIQLAQTFKVSGAAINVDVFTQAVRDIFDENPIALTTDEIRAVLQKFQALQAQAGQAVARQQAARNLAAGKAYLEANAKRDGIVTLPSGLQYKIVKAGTGRTPGPKDEVKAHYRGTLINGTEFDSSYKRGTPTQFTVRGVIAGWTEALQLMKEGAKWRLFVPAELAYGPRKTGQFIAPNSTLIFDIELIEVISGGFEFQ